MASIKLCARVLRVLAMCFVAMLTNRALAQSTQPVTAPARTITDGTTHAVVSKSNPTVVTLEDGSRTQLTSAELQAFETKPTVSVDATGKPDMRKQPVSDWINAYRQWMKDNPTSFKASLSKTEYEFVRQNNLGGLYAYMSQQARSKAMRSGVEKQTNR